jgi:homopolymeric O-antigen transport system permease protein
MSSPEAVGSADATAPTLSRAQEEPWRVNAPPSRFWPTFDLHELIAYRELVVAFAVKDLRVRYKQTFFGIAWAIFQPVLAALLFTVVFGRVAKLPTGGVPYLVFVYSGMVVWLQFSSAISAAAQSLVESRELVTKLWFPRILAPLAAVFPPLVDFLVSLVILAILVASYGLVPGFQLVLLPVWIVLGSLLALGAGLWLSALNVKYRDVKHLLPFLLQLWFFGSPVVYSSTSLYGVWRWVFALNPLTALLDCFRWSVIDAPPPGLPSLVSLAVGLLMLGSGIAYFRRVEQYFGDVI